MSMHNPSHPGAILGQDILAPMGLSITAAADALGVSRKTLSKIVNERGSITPEMALRLELVFHKPSAAHWLRLQTAYDVWQVNSRRTTIAREVHEVALA